MNKVIETLLRDLLQKPQLTPREQNEIFDKATTFFDKEESWKHLISFIRHQKHVVLEHGKKSVILLLNQLQLQPDILRALIRILFDSLSENYQNDYAVHNTMLCLFILSSKYLGENPIPKKEFCSNKYLNILWTFTLSKSADVRHIAYLTFYVFQRQYKTNIPLEIQPLIESHILRVTNENPSKLSADYFLPLMIKERLMASNHQQADIYANEVDGVVLAYNWGIKQRPFKLLPTVTAGAIDISVTFCTRQVLEIKLVDSPLRLPETFNSAQCIERTLNIRIEPSEVGISCAVQCTSPSVRHNVTLEHIRFADVVLCIDLLPLQSVSVKGAYLKPVNVQQRSQSDLQQREAAQNNNNNNINNNNNNNNAIDDPNNSSKNSANNNVFNIIEENNTNVLRASQADDLICAVCKDRPLSAQFVGCGHKACMSCARTLFESRSVCHLCRAPIVELKKIEQTTL